MEGSGIENSDASREPDAKEEGTATSSSSSGQSSAPREKAPPTSQLSGERHAVTSRRLSRSRPSERQTLEARFQAVMLLSAVGDAIGYKGGDWEFCLSTGKILRDLDALTGGKGILHLDAGGWMVSDDTVEHLAGAEGLLEGLEEVCKVSNVFAKMDFTKMDCAGE